MCKQWWRWIFWRIHLSINEGNVNGIAWGRERNIYHNLTFFEREFDSECSSGSTWLLWMRIYLLCKFYSISRFIGVERTLPNTVPTESVAFQYIPQPVLLKLMCNVHGDARVVENRKIRKWNFLSNLNCSIHTLCLQQMWSVCQSLIHCGTFKAWTISVLSLRLSLCCDACDGRKSRAWFSLHDTFCRWLFCHFSPIPY